MTATPRKAKRRAIKAATSGGQPDFVTGIHQLGRVVVASLEDFLAAIKLRFQERPVPSGGTCLVPLANDALSPEADDLWRECERLQAALFGEELGRFVAFDSSFRVPDDLEAHSTFLKKIHKTNETISLLLNQIWERFEDYQPHPGYIRLAEVVQFRGLMEALADLTRSLVDGDKKDEPFIPTPFQEAILTALEGEALRRDALIKKVNRQLGETYDARKLHKPGGLKELREHRLIGHHRRIGYYLLDAPPPKYAEVVGGNQCNSGTKQAPRRH